MKKERIQIAMLLILAAIAIIVAGCAEDSGHVITVNGEDTVVITFEAHSSAKMAATEDDQDTFVIQKEGQDMVRCRFLNREQAMEAEMAFTADPATRQITESLHKGNHFTLWHTEGAEWSYICYVKDTSVAMHMAGKDQEFTKDCFEGMTLSKEGLMNE